MSKSLKVYLAMGIAMLFWGFSFTGTGYSLDYLHPIWLVFFRLCISIIFLFGLIFLLNQFRFLKKKDVPIFVLLAVFEPFLYFLGETYGVKMSTPTTASVLIATIPLFVPIASYIAFKQKVGLFTFLGIILSIFGVLLIVFNNNLSFNTSSTGLLWLSLAVGAAVGYTLIIWKIGKNYNALEIVAWKNLIGAVFFIPFLFFNNVVISDATSYNFLIIIVISLGIFPSSFAYVFFTYGIQNLGVTRAAIFTNSIPVITAIIAFYWLKEEMTTQKIIGMTVVIIALFLSQIKIKTKAINETKQ